MNNKPCGCSKTMPVRPMGRMSKGMMSKPVCDTCKAKEWSCGEEKCNMMKNKQMGSCGCKEACAPCGQKDYMDVIVKKYGDKCNEKKYRKCDNRCEMEFGEAVDVLPIGMGYVPFQEWDCNVSNACQGLYDGTIFPELVKPFVCTYCYEEGSCR